ACEAGEGEEAVDLGQRQAVEALDVPVTRRPRADRRGDVGQAVAVTVIARDAHPTDETGEAQEARALHAVAPLVDLDAPHHRAGPRADDHLGETIVIDVARADADASVEALEGHEVPQQLARLAVEDLDVPTDRPRAGSNDQVGDAVAVDVAA